MKHIIAAIIVLVVALCAAATAQADTWWEYGGVHITERAPVTEPVEVVASSTSISVTFHVPKGITVRAKCPASGEGVFSNSEGAGHDSITVLNFGTCAVKEGCVPTVSAAALPWSATLAGETDPLTNNFTSVSADFQCGGVDYGTLTGPVSAVAGDKDPIGAPSQDEADSFIRLYGSTTSVLNGTGGATLRIAGYLRFGVKGVTVVDAGCSTCDASGV